MNELGANLTKDQDELIPTRASLLSRLRDWQDDASWKVFFDTYWRLIYHAGMKAGLSDAEAQDVVQETVISVLKSMPDFRYDGRGGSFKGWLRTVTSWRVQDQLRKRRRALRWFPAPNGDGTATALMGQIPDPGTFELEAIWEEEWEKNLMDAALERVKSEVDPKQYQIFDLYVMKGWPASKVSRTLKVNLGRVYLAKHRIGSLIKQQVDRLRTNPI